MPLAKGEGPGFDHSLVGHHRIVATPAKSRADVFQWRQGLRANTQLQIGGPHRTGHLLQQTVAERKPGFPAKIEAFHPEGSPLVLVNQSVEQPAGIDAKVQLAGKVAPEKMLAHEGKSGQLLGGTRLHGTAGCVEQSTAVVEIQLGNIQMAQVALVIPDTKIDACNLDVRIREPVTGKLQPLLQLIADRFRYFCAPHRNITAALLIHGQFQTVCLEVLKDNPQTHQRGQRSKADIQMLEVGNDNSGVRVSDLNVAGRKGGVEPVPLG